MNKTNYSLILFIIISFIFNSNALSWDDGTTHKQLSEYGTDNSVLDTAKGDYLKGIGFIEGISTRLKWDSEKTVKEWIAAGAQLEDAGCVLQMASGYGRSFNHFHNPLKPWVNAGLDDRIFLPPFHVIGESSLLWAQDGTKQATFTDLEGDWSWQKVRELFYTALTGRDFNGNVKASTQTQREEYFAQTFKGLGHQMHLLQDMAVPDHVRNDAHPEDSMFGKSPFNGSAYFESWAKEKFRNVNELKSFAPDPFSPAVSFNTSCNGLAPITQLSDAEEYNGTNPSTSITQGLSEYTNANFFSGDTIFAAERYSAGDGHYFPYPKRSSTDLQNYLAGTKPEETVVAEDGNTDIGIWISKKADGENIAHLVRTGKLTKWYYNIFGEGSLFYSSFYRDEKCHEDYARKLLPRAVGYSAGLLNYFFRGNIEITLPQSAVYSVADVEAGFFNRITLLVKNVTATGEEMSNGSIVLVAKYRIAQGDPFQSKDIIVSNDYSYTTVPEANNVGSIPKDNSIELNFDLGQTAIVPRDAVDVSLQVVFKGKLGNEDGAVAVGMKSISDPSPVDIVNNMDKICLYGTWYEAGNPEAVAQVDPNHDGIPGWDVYPHNIENAYVKISSRTTPINASPTDYTLFMPLMQPGYIYRGYILSDIDLNHSEYATAVKTTTDDVWPHEEGGLMMDTWPGTAVKASIDTYTDTASCAEYGAAAPCAVRRSPGFYVFRDMDLWGALGVIFDNPEYPVGSECPWEAL